MRMRRMRRKMKVSGKYYEDTPTKTQRKIYKSEYIKINCDVIR